ncbi:Heat-inducible transcription repressor HrcA [Bienertia sinuspersici]
MARPLTAAYSSLSTSQTGFAALSLFLCALALSLCASHSRRWRRWTMCYTRRGNDLIIQQLHDEGLIFGPPEVGENQQVSGPVWQKNILMGGKCQLPDFSGVIIYDSAGNAVTSNKPSQLALPWK